MPRENINELLAFLAVAREHGFTTTRSVSPAEAGERLLHSAGVW